MYITNFRGYESRTEISFENLTVLIGKNDAGKSTILDALDIFLNGKRPDPSDINVHSGDNETVTIECVFEPGSDSVVIDSIAQTTLASEHLLRADGMLHISYIYKPISTKASDTKYIFCNHFTRDDLASLYTQSITELKKVAESHNINTTNKTSKPALRKDIRDFFNSEKKEENYIPIKNENKDIYSSIENLLPEFVVFRTDRDSTDQDGEVQNPMKAIIKEVLSESESEISSLVEKITKKTEELTNATLEYAKSMLPEIADGLQAICPPPKLDSAFKFGIEDSRGVSINKRGSGVRRLVLFSFFQAAAERARKDSDRHIIYAIEEPETSQHPNIQEIFAQSIIRLSESKNRQMIATTHIPALACLMPINSIRYISQIDGTLTVENASTEAVIQKVVDTLGVTPNPSHPNLLIFLEGESDRKILERLSEIASYDNPRIKSLSELPVAFVITGGSNLIHWVQNGYLKKLNLKEFHLYDGDKVEYKDAIQKITSKGHLGATTSKREIENYLPIEKIQLHYQNQGQKVTLRKMSGEEDVPMVIVKALCDACGVNLPTDEKKLSKKISHVKRQLCSEEFLSLLDATDFKECDADGEISGWLETITKEAGIPGSRVAVVKISEESSVPKQS
ncbi:MAG: ATP-binding protein [Armatimonadetes bacterium]|nr:ATP-binding protein [Armatimonadota bacterium]